VRNVAVSIHVGAHASCLGGRGQTQRTSCSSRETFCSFILWTPAWAEPARAAAAIRALFMMGDASEVVRTAD